MLGTGLGLALCGLFNLSSKQPDEAGTIITCPGHKAS